jgi:hypothetical protein
MLIEYVIISVTLGLIIIFYCFGYNLIIKENYLFPKITGHIIEIRRKMINYIPFPSLFIGMFQLDLFFVYVSFKIFLVWCKYRVKRKDKSNLSVK